MSKIYNLYNRLSGLYSVFAGHSNERGAILITTLLLMVIITLIGLIAINTATVDIQISGQTKRVSKAFQGANAGVDLAMLVIENTIDNGTLTPSDIGGIITGLDKANLGTEILKAQDYSSIYDADYDTGASTPDISIANLGSSGVEVSVDIDRLYSYVCGGSLEFAAGYEGIGASTNVCVLYRIDSQGTK